MIKKKNETNVLTEKDVLSEKDAQLARALADYQNLVKRVEKEKEEIYNRSTQNLVRNLLPALDLLKAAQNHLKDTGLALALCEFEKGLEKGGLKRIQIKVGDKYNSAHHEVVDTTTDGEEGSISQVLTEGYVWNDGLIERPAKVIVSDKQS